MNILLSSVVTSKLFNDISDLILDDYTIYGHNIRGNLYRIYSVLKPKILFINLLEINIEIQQFAAEYGHECKIFCLCPRIDYVNNNINKIPGINYICYQGYVNENECLTIPSNIINESYLKSIKQDKKPKQAVCFLDHINGHYYDTISNMLYPNKGKVNIKVFNDPEFKHPQNLGYVNHANKLSLIAQSDYVICEKDFEYYYESVYLKCTSMFIEDINNGNIITEKLSSKDRDKMLDNIHDFEQFILNMVNK